jgi:hypothetical protein
VARISANSAPRPGKRKYAKANATSALDSATRIAARSPIQTLLKNHVRIGMSGRSKSFSSPATGEGLPV